MFLFPKFRLVFVLACIGMITACQPDVSKNEEFVEASGPLNALHGTLTTVTSSRAPIVLILPGSGPTDRDGNNPLGVKAATYKFLSVALAKNGIASVRVDKRGMFASSAAISDPNMVTLSDYADDVQSWISVMQKRTNTECVWLLGHSEGGLVALVSAQRALAICGIILVAVPGRPFDEILRRQLEENPANAPVLADANLAIDALKKGRSVDVTKFHPALKQLFAPQVQGFLIDLMDHDPADLIGTISAPILILQGDADLQVTRLDAERLQKSQQQARIVMLPNTNHVLKFVSGTERAKNLETYTDPTLPLAPGVVSAIVEFVNTPRQ